MFPQTFCEKSKFASKSSMYLGCIWFLHKFETNESIKSIEGERSGIPGDRWLARWKNSSKMQVVYHSFLSNSLNFHINCKFSTNSDCHELASIWTNIFICLICAPNKWPICQKRQATHFHLYTIFLHIGQILNQNEQIVGCNWIASVTGNTTKFHSETTFHLKFHFHMQTHCYLPFRRLSIFLRCMFFAAIPLRRDKLREMFLHCCKWMLYSYVRMENICQWFAHIVEIANESKIDGFWLSSVSTQLVCVCVSLFLFHFLFIFDGKKIGCAWISME